MARHRRRTRSAELTDLEWAFLSDSVPAGLHCPELWALKFDLPYFREGRPSVAQLWRTFGREVLRHWVASRPGTRPTLWWKFSAPAPRDPGESEAIFLARHGLLAPDERARVRKSDFAPARAA